MIIRYLDPLGYSEPQKRKFENGFWMIHAGIPSTLP